MRRLAIVLLVGGTLALTLLATPAVGAQAETNGNTTVVGAEINGWSATGIDFEGDRSTATTRRDIAANLSLDPDQVRLLPENNTVEVYGDNLTASIVAEGFATAGFSPNGVRKGVTDRTQNAIVSVLKARLNETGVGGQVEAITVGGTQYVTVKGANRAAVTRILRNRGRVEVLAHYPVTDGEKAVYRQTKILENEDFVRVGPAQTNRAFTDRPTVKVFLKVESAREAAATVRQAGFSDEVNTGCPDDAVEDPDETKGYCLYTVFNGEVRYARSLGEGPAEAEINFENYGDDPSVFFITETKREAEQLSMTLRTGMYPVPLSVTDLPESVESTTLQRAANATREGITNETEEVTIDTPDDTTLEDTPDDTTLEDTPDDTTLEDTPDVPTDSTSDTVSDAATTDGVVTVTDAVGPGFSPATALVALVLASAGLLAGRLR
ncbi:hypothetical protein SAMN05216388_1001339 [Halorientalis persicus]|uniref:Uncharacterized protein n=1 Tax=Halorientalis persicus TaxID=1367881 RepID=A0A1H8DQ23_9EURY|nr:hypothetical protein [Halorientalis persicus]SEN08924.1 hypothetical protein SAMN05216388_1001339 [Halorientalis persicus]